MSELQVIQGVLVQTARRRRVARALRGLWLGLLVGALVWLVTLIFYKFLPLPNWLLITAGLAVPTAILLGAILGGWRSVSLPETARWVDLERQLKERLSTALEASTTGKLPGQWQALVVRDAANHARDLDPRSLLPFHLPRATRWALLVLLLAAGLGFVPEYRSPAYLQKKNDAANIRDTGHQLAALTRRSMEMRPPNLEATKKSLEKVAETAEKLSQTPLTRGEALRELADAAKKLSDLAKELAKNPALKPLEKAARESGGRGSQSPEALQKQMDALQKSLGKNAATPDALDKLRDKLQGAQQKAANLPNQDSAAASAARSQLAQSLSELSKEAKDLGSPLEGLEQAIAALQQGQAGLVAKDLEAALDDLDKTREMAKNLQRLQQQAAQLGKNLAEQLANGQVDAARSTLGKMMQQLAQSGLKQEQLQQIMDEVSKAVDPAGQYGKVKEHLQDAAKQLGKGQNGPASQSLAQAAKELEKLQQEMNDAQSMAESLAALDRAQDAVASGQSWGQCQGNKCSQCNGKGCALCKGTGWSKGGKPGAGVGTWAEDEGWSYYPDKQTPVDNSGIIRPDMEGKSPTARDPTEVTADRFKPSKTKGQLSPGGQMPSITLKGVAVKGQSTLEYQQAAASAQTEAQSALNQDQVPRAYQNAVKDYFDDLKK